MPLGDSITQGVSGSTYNIGYRRTLYLDLIDADHTVDFVGTQVHGSAPYDDFDRDHEGHSGWQADEIRDNITSWLITNEPDIVLLHIGTNDIWHDDTYGHQDPDGIIAEVNDILDNIDAYEANYDNPITVVLAQIINRTSAASAIELQYTEAYNDKLAELYDTRKAAGDDIVLVDMYNALTYPDDMADSAHPNDTGYNKMAVVWYNALDPIMNHSVYHVTLEASSPLHTTDDDLMCTYSLGSDNATSATAWYKDGTPIMELYLPMEGGDANALNDYSGKGITCTAAGGVAWSAAAGHDGNGAFVFDGSGDYLDAGENFPIRSSYTKTAWVYRTDSNTDAHNIISGDAGSGGHAFWMTDNKLSAGHNSAWTSVQDTAALAQDTWYFVAVSYDAATDTMVLYKNGVEVDSATVTDDVTDATALIGSYNHGYLWIGTIDDARVYNYALTAEQIAVMYNSGSGNNTTIVSQETSAGETWQAEVTPFSDVESGFSVLSDAVVIAPAQYTITTVTQGSGSITLDPAGGTYAEGTSVTLTATAGTDYQFDRWEGDVSGSTNPLTVSVDRDMRLTAVFVTLEGDSSTFTSSGGEIITVAVSAGTLTLQETSEAVPDNLDFVYSPMDIDVNNIPIGATVDVTIDLPSAAPMDASVYKFIDGSWVNFDSYCQLNAQRTSVTFQITDGGYGDNDNAADGKISDPIGIATAVNNSSNNSSGGGGGCFIESIF